MLHFHRERKFILGNAKGEVAVYNFRNGAKMKDLDTQGGPIVGLIYCAQEKAVLVACQARLSLSIAGSSFFKSFKRCPRKRPSPKFRNHAFCVQNLVEIRHSLPKKTRKVCAHDQLRSTISSIGEYHSRGSKQRLGGTE